MMLKICHFVVSGTGTYRVKNNTYKINTGEMFVITPYEETYYEADSQNPWSYIWIGFRVDGTLPKQLDDVIRAPEALNIFNAMKNCERFSNGRNAYLCGRLWDLFALLLDLDGAQYNYVDRALEYIHSEYMRSITIQEIANHLNVDRTYFSVLFKKRLGFRPSNI